MKKISSTEASRHLKAMARAASAASELILKHYGRLKSGQIRAKSRNDFVTFVDKRAQEMIIRILTQEFPEYGVQAEEGVLEVKDRMWIIDPLDGTSNYIHQFPLFCTSIAAVEKGKSLVGLVHDPVHRETFTAALGQGARVNGRPIRVSGVKKLADAFVSTGFPYCIREYFEPYNISLKKVFYSTAGIRRGGSAALDLCYTACGRFDGFWELGLSPWDIAAGCLIVEEAGGRLSDFKGRPYTLTQRNLVAGSRIVQKGLVRVLKDIRGFDGIRPKCGP